MSWVRVSLSSSGTSARSVRVPGPVIGWCRSFGPTDTVEEHRRVVRDAAANNAVALAPRRTSGSDCARVRQAAAGGDRGNPADWPRQGLLPDPHRAASQYQDREATPDLPSVDRGIRRAIRDKKPAYPGQMTTCWSQFGGVRGPPADRTYGGFCTSLAASQQRPIAARRFPFVLIGVVVPTGTEASISHGRHQPDRPGLGTIHRAARRPSREQEIDMPAIRTGISTNSARGPETTGITAYQSDNADTRAGRPTLELVSPPSVPSAGKTADQASGRGAR